MKYYYENKVRESDSKMTVNYELKNSHPIMVKRPNKKRIINLKTHSNVDLSDYRNPMNHK